VFEVDFHIYGFTEKFFDLHHHWWCSSNLIELLLIRHWGSGTSVCMLMYMTDLRFFVVVRFGQCGQYWITATASISNCFPGVLCVSEAGLVIKAENQCKIGSLKWQYSTDCQLS